MTNRRLLPAMRSARELRDRLRIFGGVNLIVSIALMSRYSQILTFVKLPFPVRSAPIDVMKKDLR